MDSYFKKGVSNHKTVHDFLASLLRMSAKYQASDLQQEVLKGLSGLYPYPPSPPPTHIPVAETSSIVAVIHASRMAGAEYLLPVAFYYLATRPLNAVIFSLQNLQDIHQCLNGREKLLRRQQDSVWYIQRPQELCHISCFENWMKFLHSATGKDMLNRSAVFSANIGQSAAPVCETFKGIIHDQIRASQDTIWDCLPAYFMLDDWATLRKPLGARKV